MRQRLLFAASVYFAYACACVACATATRDTFDSDGGADAAKDRAVLGPAETGPFDDGGLDDGGACGTKVVINELMTGTPDASQAEFIELYNPGGCAVPMSDWKLSYRASTGTLGPPLLTFPIGSSIAAKSYLVAAREQFPGKSDVMLTGGSMAADNGQVALLDDMGKVIDGVGYGVIEAGAGDGSTYVEKQPAPSPPSGGSIARHPNGVDTDDNKTDFVQQATHSAGAENP